MELEQYWVLVLMVATRTGVFLLISPFFRERSIPVLAKMSIVLSISLFIAPSLEVVEVEALPKLLGLLVQEALLGFVLAYMVEVIFSITRVAGSFIDVNIGLANPFFDQAINSQSTPLSRIFYYFFLMLFIILGGFELLITGFARTFELQVPSGNLINEGLLEYFIDLFNYMFFGALQISIPFMMIAFLVHISLLLMSKSVDKINVLMNVFGIKILAGLVMLLLCVPVLMIVFSQLNEDLIEKFLEILNLIFIKK